MVKFRFSDKIAANQLMIHELVDHNTPTSGVRKLLRFSVSLWTDWKTCCLSCFSALVHWNVPHPPPRSALPPLRKDTLSAFDVLGRSEEKCCHGRCLLPPSAWQRSPLLSPSVHSSVPLVAKLRAQQETSESLRTHSRTQSASCWVCFVVVHSVLSFFVSEKERAAGMSHWGSSRCLYLEKHPHCKHRCPPEEEKFPLQLF